MVDPLEDGEAHDYEVRFASDHVVLSIDGKEQRVERDSFATDEDIEVFIMSGDQRVVLYRGAWPSP